MTESLGYPFVVDAIMNTTVSQEYGGTVYQETFEGKNFHKFRGFVAIHESFLREFWGMVSVGVAKGCNP